MRPIETLAGSYLSRLPWLRPILSKLKWILSQLFDSLFSAFRHVNSKYFPSKRETGLVRAGAVHGGNQGSVDMGERLS